MTLSIVKQVYETNKIPYNTNGSAIKEAKSMKATLSRVIDGDTVEIKTEGQPNDTVRLIGINTPEKNECFASEASNHLKTLAEGKEIILVTDPTQDERDMYGRLLAYLYLGSETSLNQRMVAEGYAKEYTYMNHAYEYQSEFKSAEASAKGAELGIWSACRS